MTQEIAERAEQLSAVETEGAQKFLPLGIRTEDLAGFRFSRLIAFGLVGRSPTKWRCRCDCGREISVRAGQLKSQKTRSCGCLLHDVLKTHARTHGKSKGGNRVPEYWVWQGMLNRCRNPNHVGYRNYGGRGIAVCERWRSFENFLKDMGSRPTAQHTIERINNDDNYEPSNCRWATRVEQARNNRRWSRT